MSEVGLSRHWQLSGQRTDVSLVADQLEALVADGALSPREGNALQLAIEEALMNVITHGLEGVEAPLLSLALHADAQQIEIRLRDNGPPFDPLTEASAPDLEAALEDRSIGGLGIHLLRQTMDDVSYRRAEDHNELRMVLRR
ncbi:MAG: ATP-binding protein [Rhodospirillaceae bacterium]